MASSCLRASAVCGAGLPGVDHLAGGFGFLVALDAIGQHFDAGGEHQAVVADAGAALGCDHALGGVDAGHHVLDHLDAVPGQFVVAVGDVIHGTACRQHPVGNRAGDELVVRLDQGDVDVGAPRAQVFGTGGTTEAGADHDDVGAGCRKVAMVPEAAQPASATAAPAPEIFRKSRRFIVMIGSPRGLLQAGEISRPWPRIRHRCSRRHAFHDGGRALAGLEVLHELDEVAFSTPAMLGMAPTAFAVGAVAGQAGGCDDLGVGVRSASMPDRARPTKPASARVVFLHMDSSRVMDKTGIVFSSGSSRSLRASWFHSPTPS